LLSIFDGCFRALTDFSPLRWQERLFQRLMGGTVPTAVDLPTGLGKTSVIPIWLIALAYSEAKRLPRRLVYIVNRRTVVDHATSIVMQIREQLRNRSAPLEDLADRLHAMTAISAADVPFAVSTLRGELADNEEWKADPARPAVIIGTVDMIGSKLLFSGYGDGRYGRIHHAGLIGQDTLIVHDEAHLTPAFGELLRHIANEQERSHEPRRVHVMELSATQRRTDGDAFGLQADDESNGPSRQIVRQRLDAGKRLHLHECDNVVAGLVERAKSYIRTPAKVLVYVRSPEDAQKVTEAIRKELGSQANQRVALLTGTIRGYERDRMVSENPVYRAMLDPAARGEHSVFLVSTSAGEVGIDIDADHMVCDLTTLDSMIQRLGRVNRRGGDQREARVDVVWTVEDAEPGAKASQVAAAIARTLHILQKWARDSADKNGLLVSPRNLRKLVESLSDQQREQAFSPQPEVPPLTDILLDNWSLTGIDDMPGRPQVATYLHGLTADPPETFIAWRNEVMRFKDLQPSGDGSAVEASEEAHREFAKTLSNWFRACRIEAGELLRDRTDRVRKMLDALLKAHRKTNPHLDFPVVLLDERGHAQWSSLSAIVKKPEGSDPDPLRYRTVVLPTEAGGLDRHGMLTSEIQPQKGPTPPEEIDVAESVATPRQRWLLSSTPDGKLRWQRLLTDEVAQPPQDLKERERIALREPPEGAEDEGESLYLLLLESPRQAAQENPEAAPLQQTLAQHTDGVASYAATIADRLGLDAGVREALVMAARWHDRGKDRPLWQRFARNDNVAVPLAKSASYLHGRVLGGYRHEFGSLLEAMDDHELRHHPERDLVLHLIAAHHGWGRPHFEPRAFDHEGPRDPQTGEHRAPTTADNEAALVEAMQRFGRLQQRFGRWGLAWLESLLRCADIAASQQLPSPTNHAAGPGNPLPKKVPA
jgi:CRISPR-associated endonuclease/helicase Cas3